MPEKSNLRKKIWWSILLFFVLAIIAFILWFRSVAIDNPPDVKDTTCVKSLRLQVDENIFTLGNNWLRKNKSGLWEMYVEGKPFERGVAFGKLTSNLLNYQEQVFVDQINELVPSPSYLKFLKYFVAFFNRDLDENITTEYKQEIYGISLSGNHKFDFIGTSYQRQLNYHAAHDIGHALQSLNMVGCTSFSFWGSKSSDSSLMVGRNFDFYAGDKFAENKLVSFYNPSEGYKFMMVGWAGMTGVVSGMNEKGLTVTINAAKSSIPTKSATPISLLAREILQYSSNISEAYEIAQKRKTFVSESIMIGSASDYKTAIIEKSPEKIGLYQSDTCFIICTNHFQGSVFAKDEANMKNIKESDSQFRYKRVAELLEQYNIMDATQTAAILRNQKGVGNTDVGMGNETINQLIAHHAVIFNASKLIAWVSTPPYQLGKFVAYDLHKIFNLKISPTSLKNEINEETLSIPSDTFLTTKNFYNYLKYRRLTLDLKKSIKHQNMLLSSFDTAYIKTNPEFYQTYENLGNYYKEKKQNNKAIGYYQKALTKIIPGLDEKEKMEAYISKLKK